VDILSGREGLVLEGYFALRLTGVDLFGLLASALGTTIYWGGYLTGNEYCVDCVPIGLSTFRFLHWPFFDLIMDVLYVSTAVGLLVNWKYVYFSGMATGLLFLFMAVLAVYTDFVMNSQTQPLFLNLWFVFWGSFMVWFMHHWQNHWKAETSRASSNGLRKTGSL